MKTLREYIKNLEILSEKQRVDELLKDAPAIAVRKLTNLLMPGKISRGKAETDKATSDIFNEWLIYKGQTGTPSTYRGITDFLKNKMGLSIDILDQFIDLISPITPLKPAFITTKLINRIGTFDEDNGNFTPLDTLLDRGEIYNIIAELVRIRVGDSSGTSSLSSFDGKPFKTPIIKSGDVVKVVKGVRRTLKDIKRSVDRQRR